jgi:hypothetical protein
MQAAFTVKGTLREGNLLQQCVEWKLADLRQVVKNKEASAETRHQANAEVLELETLLRQFGQR